MNLLFTALVLRATTSQVNDKYIPIWEEIKGQLHFAFKTEKADQRIRYQHAEYQYPRGSGLASDILIICFASP